MTKKQHFNILMYSHDTYGLGHIRRSMAIAARLTAPEINTIIITGSPLVGRFDLPEQIDFIRIPGMIKKTNEVYQPLSVKINPRHAIHIREQIIKTTARCFQPDMFIVDKEPLGLKKEILATLQWIRGHLPQCRTILGLRDIMDDSDTVRRDWEKKGIYDTLDTLYDEIWIYGIREFYDPILEYAIPEALSRKIVFTGYIPRGTPNPSARIELREKFGISPDEKLVIVTLGGGGDGFSVADAFLSMIETAPVPYKTLLITGPFMPRDHTDEINRRADLLSVKVYRFFRQMEKLISAADLIVTMGGYNTICEILSQKKTALVIPRESPRQEQLIRARVMKSHDLLDFIRWNELEPELLRTRISELLTMPRHIQAGLDRFVLTGVDTMRQRLELHRSSAP